MGNNCCSNQILYIRLMSQEEISNRTVIAKLYYMYQFPTGNSCNDCFFFLSAIEIIRVTENLFETIKSSQG